MSRLFTCLLFAAAMLTAGAYDYKVGDLCYNINEDGNTVSVAPEKSNGGYTSLGGKVTIPRMVLIENRPYTVTAIGRNAFYYCKNITEVVIGDAVTIIDSFAFEDCSGLTSVTFGRVLQVIGFSSFSGCKSLTTLDIPKPVKEIGESAFDGCTSLTTITLPSTLLTIGRSAFAYCSKVTTINGGENVERMGRGAIDYTKWYSNQPNGVVYFGKVAVGVRGDVPETITFKEGIVSIAPYFVSSDYLLHVNFPSTLKEIGEQSFEFCRELNNVTFPASLEVIGPTAFDACMAFTDVVIPDNVTTIGNNAFSRSSNITKVTIGKGVTSIGQTAFTSCTGLQHIYSFPDPDLVVMGKDVFYRGPSSSCVLHVKSEYLSKYETADQWKNFMPNIVDDLSDAPAAKKGDVNGDGEVGIADVTVLVDLISNRSENERSDVNGDGETGIPDVTVLVSLILESLR